MPLRLSDLPFDHPWRSSIAGDVAERSARRQKFNAKPVTANGEKYGSEKEYARFCELQRMERVGLISMLRPHPKFLLFAAGRCVSTYTPDAFYLENGQSVAEDTKGGKATKTEAYSLRVRLLKANYPTIIFREVT